MSTTPTSGKEFSGRPRYQPYTGPRIYKHVSRSRPCLICGKTDWCSYSLNGEVSCCARKTEGADYISKKEGWGIYFHNKDAGRLAASAAGTPRRRKSPPRPTPVAPLEVRDAVYRKLMELSPATNHPAELIEGDHGLLARGFTHEDFPRFGSLPAEASDRAALARELRTFVRAEFYELRSLAVAEWYATLSGAPLEEVTKVWREMRYEVKS